MKRALETGQDAPADLIEFDMEQSFWERFGARLSPEWLGDWPRKKIERYREIIRTIDEVERDRAPSTGTSSPASTQSPEDTERVFQEALKQKRERERQA